MTCRREILDQGRLTLQKVTSLGSGNKRENSPGTHRPFPASLGLSLLNELVTSVISTLDSPLDVNFIAMEQFDDFITNLM